MVTKPLSWLTSAAAAVEPELGIPTSSSTNSLSSIARRRAAAQASIKPSSEEIAYEKDAPTRAARAVGQGLAAGLRSRSNLHDDEESQLRPPPPPTPPTIMTSNPSSSMSMSRLVPGPASPRLTRKKSPDDGASPLAGPSSLPKVADSGSSDKAMTWSSRSSKRMLHISSRQSTNPDNSLEVLSDADPASPPPQAQPYHPRSHYTLRSPPSQLLGYPRSSLRPDDAMSESASASMSHSNSFSAFGYGNQVRYADSAFGLPPSSSPFQLSSRTSRAPFTSSLLAHAASPGRASRAGSVSLRGGSPAPSTAYSPAPPCPGTPQRRNWNGINLATPSAPSVGDEMMRQYLSLRTLPAINPTIRRSLGLPTDEPMITSSVAGGSLMDETESLTPSRLGKRDIDMSVDGDSQRFGTPSKRRMVWHPELGFISHEELKAREPKLPSPKNEAERLLNVLETLRKPTNTSHGLGTSKAPPATINVPAPISDLPASASRNAKSNNGKPSVGVAPYTRYLRKAKAVQASEGQGGMRARLKKAQPAASRANMMDTDDVDEESRASEPEDAEQAEEEEEEEEEPAPAPLQPEPIRRSRRLQHQAPSSDKVTQTPVKQQADKAASRTTQLKSALKATPLRPSAQNQSTPFSAIPETPKPASHRIPLSVANKAPSSTAKKDNFSVKTSSDPTAPRERSSFRQGAAKTSRTHQSSGKFSAWDEDDEEEDLPDASELAKIKLPTNMFPSGFSFRSSSSSSSTSTAPAAASKPATSSSDSSASTGGSLLGRLGGLDSSAAPATAPEKKAEAHKPAASSFSFSAPSKDAPNTMPKFSFGAPAAASGKDQSNATASAQANKSNAPPASGFFSKPAEPAAPISLNEGKKDGPVPNFFGSTMKKFETGKPADAPAAAAASSTGGFSFGASSSTAGSGGFTFGTSSAAAAAAAASTGPKRGADKDSEPAAKKSMPSFSFGSTSSSSAPAAASSSSFSFGTPTTGEKKEETPKSDMPNFFGAKGDSSTTDAASKPTAFSGEFSFGKPAESTATSAPASALGSAGFSFGTPKPAPATDAARPAPSGFSFGSTTASSPAPESTPSSTFSFGASKPASESAPASAPGSGSTTPTFSFGAPASTSGSDASKPPAASTGGFSFGTPSSSNTGFGSTTGGFGGFGVPKPTPTTNTNTITTTTTGAGAGAGAGGNSSEMMDDSPQKTTPAASTPSFTFGSSTPTPASTAAKPPSTFTFGSSPAPGPATSTAPNSASGSTFAFGAPSSTGAGGAGGAGGGFRFGSPSPNPAPPTSAAPASTPFTFGSGATGTTTPGVGSTPASPFLAPQGVPTTPGGSPFQFGSNPTPVAGGATFQFSASTNSASAPGGGGGFGFGTPSAAPTFGAPNPTPGFGGGGGFGTPTTPSAAPGGGGFTFGGAANGIPQLPQTPGAPGGGAMFSMGAAPSGGPNSTANSAGGRQIKPLRQRRR
ncbi:related to Nuclear pore complex protein Nup214 [Ustilago bromivora]|nr:related to Nuclear pore complex protein Nup214 [Ustilago bromivora]